MNFAQSVHYYILSEYTTSGTTFIFVCPKILILLCNIVVRICILQYHNVIHDLDIFFELQATLNLKNKRLSVKI